MAGRLLDICMCRECFSVHGGGVGPSMGLGRTAQSESIHTVLFDRSDDLFVFAGGMGAEFARSGPSAKLESRATETG